MNQTFSPNWEILKSELSEKKAKSNNGQKRKSKPNFSASPLKKKKINPNSEKESSSAIPKNQKIKSNKKSNQKLKENYSKANESVPNKKGQVETSLSKSQKGLQSASPDIWFDDVDVKDIIAAGEENMESLHLKSDDDNVLVKPDAFDGMTKVNQNV